MKQNEYKFLKHRAKKMIENLFKVQNQELPSFQLPFADVAFTLMLMNMQVAFNQIYKYFKILILSSPICMYEYYLPAARPLNVCWHQLMRRALLIERFLLMAVGQKYKSKYLYIFHIIMSTIRILHFNILIAQTSKSWLERKVFWFLKGGIYTKNGFNVESGEFSNKTKLPGSISST